MTEPAKSSVPDARSDKIGPGRLVVVVGPSGAGKDTLISMVRAWCEADDTVMFPRRIVTRSSSAAEDHHSVTEKAFERDVAAGNFAFWWEAHGLKYGLSSSINADIRAGRTIVCNVSRTLVDTLRSRYMSLTAVLVTAPPQVLEQRLIGRGRSSDGSLADRMRRSEMLQFDPDVIIENTGCREAAGRKLLEIIRMRSFSLRDTARLSLPST